MVRVWYEPPPFGPRTALNRAPYGIAEGTRTPQWLMKLSKMPKYQSITASVGVACLLAYIPLIGTKLPFTMSPEYQAAQRAYMRYHNMNPIYGISSKEER